MDTNGLIDFSRIEFLPSSIYAFAFVSVDPISLMAIKMAQAHRHHVPRRIHCGISRLNRDFYARDFVAWAFASEFCYLPFRKFQRQIVFHLEMFQEFFISCFLDNHNHPIWAFQQFSSSTVLPFSRLAKIIIRPI